MGIRTRYTKDIELHLPDEEIREYIDHFLQTGGFYPTIWNGEGCFCADYFPATCQNHKQMYFFQSDYANGILHIQAWVRDGKNAETGITGAYNLMVKQPYLNQITAFENGLINKLPANSELWQKNQAALKELNRKNSKTAKVRHLVYALSLVLLLWAFYEVLVRRGL